MKSLFALATVLASAAVVSAADLRIESIATNGAITWSGAYTAGVINVQTSTNPAGPWTPRKNFYTSNQVGGAKITLSSSNTFVRLLSVDISTNSAAHFTNLAQSYGILETVAGRGQYSGDHINYYSNSLEGGFATNMNLSRPHIAFGDAAGNIYIVDQGSSAIEKVTPDGRIHTFAGTHVAGDNGDGPAPATNLQLRFPNGGWLGANGTFYILDTENGKVRKVDTNGIMSTMFATAPNYMGDGRALWVKSDESEVYFGSGPGVNLNVTTLNKWTPTGGVSVVAANFLDVGNILGDERTGDLYITDRDAYRIYRMNSNNVIAPFAGTGYTTNFPGGGEGGPALSTALILPRSIWFIPNGGYFISEHDGGSAGGNRIWYVDPAGLIHRWVNGSSSANSYGLGDGQWFYANPTMAKMSRVRSVNTDPNGNLIIVESNNGYVRRIRFERLTP